MQEYIVAFQRKNMAFAEYWRITADNRTNAIKVVTDDCGKEQVTIISTNLYNERERMEVMQTIIDFIDNKINEINEEKNRLSALCTELYDKVEWEYPEDYEDILREWRNYNHEQNVLSTKAANYCIIKGKLESLIID